VSIYQRDPAAPGANVKRREAGSAGARSEHGVTLFNESPAGRKVAGLVRSLGGPRVSVGAGAGSPGQVRITVAWELCWYQWEVDSAGGGVLELAKGTEVEQLDRAARHWNASLGEDAQVVFGDVGRTARRRRWLRRR
jgi:hypothetical protein